MDLDEWEFIPDEGLLQIHDDGGKKIFSRKHWKVDPSSMFNMNYFKPPQFVDSTPESKFPNQIVPLPVPVSVPVPIQFHPPNHEQVKQIIEIPVPISIEPTKIESPEADRESASQVSFKNTKENHEFVDMKMDSPKSVNRVVGPIGEPKEVMKIDTPNSGSRGIMGQIGESMEVKSKSLDSELKGDQEVVIWRESNNGGLNIWKWGLNGIGAICSFGVAAATICIIILGSGNKQTHHKISFQLYEDDNKRINQVVHQTTKLNEVISAARGVQLSRAHIRYGGYYDAL